MPTSPSAAPPDRPRVVSTSALAVFGALIGAAMVLLFPYQTLVKQSLEARSGDALAVAYLHNLLRTETDNARMRFVLAAQHQARGEMLAAQQAVAPLADHPDPATRDRARWLMWRYAADDTASATAPLGADQAETLRMLATTPTLSDNDRITLIFDAARHHQFAIAIRALNLLAAQSTLDDESAIDAAKRLRAAAQPLLAARFYLLARQRVRTVDEQRECFLDALRTLQAVSDFETAFLLADRDLGSLAEDGPTLAFLIQLARAANQPQRAAGYARQLMRLTLLEQLDPAHHGALRQVSTNALDTLTELPFNSERYQLAYDTFLAAGALGDAYALAASAVRQAPGDAVWRARLAQVAEWLGKPAEALRHWHVLAGAGDDAAWAHVLRLAPGLYAHTALLDAQKHALSRRPGDAALLRTVAATFERLGQAEEGLAFLHHHVARHRSAEGYGVLAAFAERAGRGDVADAALAVLEQRYGTTPERSTRRAAGLIARDQWEIALGVLDAARANAPDTAIDYWRLRASLAGLLQDTATQRDALARLVPQATARPQDFFALVELLRATHPDQAARLAERAWRHFGKNEWLLRSLELHLFSRNYAAMGALIESLDAQQMAALARDPDFLRLRGQWRQGIGDHAAAQADFIAALQRAPGNTTARASLLWLLVDTGRGNRLRALMARHEGEWARDADLHDVLAAVSVKLSRPQHALDAYLLPRASAHRNDFLWMMGLADTLEQAGDIDRAWRVREALWRQSRTQRPSTLPNDALAIAQRAAEVRLAQQHRPGDASHQLLRALLSQDDESEPLDNPLLRDLVMSWYLSAGDVEGARGFLWERYADALSRPIWADAALALATDDRRALKTLLDRDERPLPATQRAEIARALARPAIAASASFDAATDQHANDDLHLQMTEVLLDQAHRLRLETSARHVDTLDENTQTAQLRMRLTPRLKLTVTLARTGRKAPARGPLIAHPDSRRAVLEFEWTHEGGSTRFGIGRQHGFADTTPWWIGHEEKPDRRWVLALEMGAQLPANENTALQVAGMKNQLLASATYGLSSRERISAQWAHSRYATQHGLDLGRADRWQLDYVHRLSTGRPEIEAGAYLGGYRFRADVGVNADARDRLRRLTADGLSPLLPDSFLFKGVQVSINARHRYGFHRALVPYAAFDLNHVSGRGLGYGVVLGVSGQVLNADQFTLGVQFDKGGEGEAGRSTALFLEYQLFF